MRELLKKDFYFDLPPELIAQDPLEDRSGSRLLVLDQETGEIEHRVFTDIVEYLREGDCLVLNTGIPYPIPFGEIDRVELSYSPWELENRMSYNLGVTVFRKNGKKKWVYYKGYKTAKLATPQDMEAAMREHGIPCVMVEK